MLANLAPGDVEEAKLMIPSLAVGFITCCWSLHSQLRYSRNHVCLFIVFAFSLNHDFSFKSLVPSWQGKMKDDEITQIIEEVAIYR